MQGKVVVIHTSPVSLDVLKSLFREILPEVKMVNIIDDSLLAEVMEYGGPTKGVISRMCTYAMQAEAMGADVILNQCSSVGEVVDIARKMVNVPIVKIDEAMAEKAVEIGKKISVIATVSTTMGPSVRLIRKVAQDKGKEVEINECLVDGALKVLLDEKNVEKHNRMVLDVIKKAADESDVVVLAQGSMVVLLPYLTDLKVPVLSSPELGVKRVKEVLEKR